MPRKKRVRRKRVRRKRPRKKRPRKRALNAKRKINLSWKSLILFAILFVLSYVLYSATSNTLLINFFGILAIIFGVLAAAFLIALLVYLFLK